MWNTVNPASGRHRQNRKPMRLALAGALLCALPFVSSLSAKESTARAFSEGRGASSGVAQLQAELASSVAQQDEADLKALTDQVLKSLETIAGGDTQGKKQQEAPGNYDQLMRALGALVEKATQQGKSSEDILALIEEALAGQDDATLEALIAQAGGKVELRRLLQTLVRKAAMKATADDPYTRMLQAEGEATNTGDAAAGSSATSVAGDRGERVIVVQPGDTLGTIALRHYGSVGAWRKIFEANRHVLSDPNLVPAGVRLRLP